LPVAVARTPLVSEKPPLISMTGRSEVEKPFSTLTMSQSGSKRR
jgi:hypothetical protein